jgi:hypothetical protein
MSYFDLILRGGSACNDQFGLSKLAVSELGEMGIAFEPGKRNNIQ